MGIPAAVRRQAEEADRLIAQMSAESAPAEPQAQLPNQEGTEPAPAPNADTPPSNNAPQNQNQLQLPENLPAPENNGVEYWRHKFKVLEGKYRAEVPRLHETRRNLEARVAELEGQLAQLNANPQRPAGSAEDEDFDPALIALVERRAQAIAQQMIGQRVDPLQARAEQIESMAQMSARERFESDLTDLLGASHGVDWRAIDPLPQWHQFLAERDRMSGYQRQELLNRAVVEHDADAAAALFQAFLEAAGYRRPQAQQAQQRANSLAAQVVPETAAGGGIPQPNKRSYTRAEVSQHYATLAKARANRSTPPSVMAELLKTDADISAALSEGRVR